MSFIQQNVTPQVPSIPVPTEEPASLRAAIMAIKTALETTIGSAGLEPHPNMYVQNTQPTARKKGDLWIVEYPSIKVSYWTGSAWVVLAVAP